MWCVGTLFSLIRNITTAAKTEKKKTWRYASGFRCRSPRLKKNQCDATPARAGIQPGTNETAAAIVSGQAIGVYEVDISVLQDGESIYVKLWIYS
jgi:hypothetical protein